MVKLSFGKGNSELYDVLVVGGGPVGSYAAYRLAGVGHKVIVLERKDRVGERLCCTGIIGQECFSSFAIGEGVVLRRVRSANLFSPSGNLLRLEREESQACILDRVAFDIDMANQARAKGAEFLLGVLVRKVEFLADRVKIEASHQGKAINFESKTVIIASGFGLRLTEKLGLGRVGDFVVGAQADVETAGIEEVEVYFGRDMAPGFFAWLVPTATGVARVGLLSRSHPGHYLGKLLTVLKAEGKIRYTEARLHYGGIPLKPLARTYRERLVVMGDAAGQVKPTTGGGIYYGLLCADIAANILHEALEDNDLSAKRLAKYERLWKKKLGRELKVDYWARRLFERLDDRQIDRVFDIVKDYGIDKALLRAQDLSFDWHSQAILRLTGYGVLAKAVNVVKLPLRAGKS